MRARLAGLVVNVRGVGAHRVFDIDDRLQGLVVDVDALGGVLGNIAVASDDQGHRLADEAHLVGRHSGHRRRPDHRLPHVQQDRWKLAKGRQVDQRRTEVVRRVDRFHALDGQRFAGVDGFDAGMGEGGCAAHLPPACPAP